MSIEKTLERVRRDVQRGDLGLARDRLHCLISSFPHDLELRPHLAEIYWKLQHPGMAGLYWYLVPDPTEEMRAAIEFFERECGGDPWVMLRRLKVRKNPSQMKKGFAHDQLMHLIADSKKKHKHFPEVIANRELREKYDVKDTVVEKIQLWGCGLIVFIILVLSGIGFFHLVGLIY